MKFASFVHDGRPTWGVVEADRVRPVVGMALPTLRDALREGALDEGGAAAFDEAIDATRVQWLPPVPEPGKIICVGRNYGAHIAEAGLKRPDFPSLFTRFSDTLVASGDALVRPTMSEQFDFEGEVAVIIGKAGRTIAHDAALDHVFGYTLFNDASVRDVQMQHSLIAGKNFFRTGGFGPVIRTRDDIPDYRSLRLTTRLNGDIMQDATLGEMIFDLETLIAYISAFTPLAPGDVILTGTPEGVGLARKPPVWLKQGDRIDVSVDEIGTLTNTVVDQA